MGITNPDPMTMKNGAQLSDCYLTFIPSQSGGNFPPLTLSWSVNNYGVKQYTATGTLHIYLSKACMDAGMTPVQVQQVSISANDNSQAVFSVFYDSLKSQYPNSQP